MPDSWREPFDAPDAPDLADGGRLSQTLLSKADRCEYSAYLYVKHGGGLPSHAMARGSAFHMFAELWVKHLVENNLNVGEPEEAKGYLHAVLDNFPEIIPASEQDGLRVMAHHFAEGTWIDPGEVVAVEDKFDVEIGGRTVSGKIDLGMISGALARLHDYKTSFAIPDQATFEGRFQLPLYAVVFSEGKIRDEPIGVGAGLARFELREIFPRYFWDAEGTMAYRETVIDYASILDHKLYLERLVGRVERAFADKKFRAVPGSHCSECPLATACPIPLAARGYEGELSVNADLAEAQDVATRWFFNDRGPTTEGSGPPPKQDWKALRAWVDLNGPLRFGKDLVLELVTEEREELRRDKAHGKENFRIAIEQAVAIGTPFEWTEWHRPKISTKLKCRTLTPTELQEEEDAGSSDD